MDCKTYDWHAEGEEVESQRGQTHEDGDNPEQWLVVHQIQSDSWRASDIP